MRVGTILVVCTGNVCRSPYIERRLRDALNVTGIIVSSAGIAALEGHVMEPEVAGLLRQHGASAEGFSARRLTADMVADADLVVAAAREHRGAAARLHPAALRKALTLRDLADLLQGVSPQDVADAGEPGSWVSQVVAVASSRRPIVVARQEGVDLVDPIGQPSRVFRRMADEAEDALRVIVPVLSAVPVQTGG